LFVVNKPPGLVVHGGDAELSGDLVSRLKRTLRARGEDDYLGVHQRLDTGTSGVLAFTRDPEQNAGIAEQMSAHTTARTYVAVVSVLAKSALRDAGSFEQRLETVKNRTRVVKSGGVHARTLYRVLERAKDRALVELQPETGRTHQLRVHLAHAGAPIVGDELYGGTPAERLFLHARSLAFERPKLRFDVPPPESFEDALHARAPRLGSLARIREALADAGCLRFPLCAQNDTFRIANDLGDGLPGVCIDRYGDFAVLSLASDEASAHAQALSEMLHDAGARGVYVKQRAKADLRRETHEHLAPKTPAVGAAVPSELVVHEGNARFRVTLDDGLSCGLFLDQRDNRARVAALAGGQRVLNLFSYTCSFSVAAALGGAAKVTSVDLSGRALERGKRNFAENARDPGEHEFVQTDAVRFVRGAVKHGRRFDLIVLDPPSFATVGKATFRFERDIGALMTDCLRLLTPRGKLLCVTNHKKTSVRQFRQKLEQAAEQAKRRLKIRELPSGLDCPEALDGPHPSKSLLAEVVVGTEP